MRCYKLQFENGSTKTKRATVGDTRNGFNFGNEE